MKVRWSGFRGNSEEVESDYRQLQTDFIIQGVKNGIIALR